MKKRNGFTLIELLAVIVILAIIALIATPLVLKYIESAKKGATESSAYAYVEAVEDAIATYMLNNNGSEPTSIDDLTVEVKGDAPKSKTVCLANGVVSKASLEYTDYKVYYDGTKAYVDDDREVTCDTTPSTPVTPTKAWTAVTGDGTNIGDEIAVGDEHFYVISNDGTTLNALAKYNLNVGNTCTNYNSCTPIENPTGKQDASMKGYYNDTYGNGSVAFSNAVNWTAGEDGIETKATGTLHDALYAENGYEKYIQQTAPSAAVRLIKKSELDDLKNNQGNPSWLYSTSYWSGSSYSGNASRVWNVYSHGYLGDVNFSVGNNFGVRPVITLES